MSGVDPTTAAPGGNVLQAAHQIEHGKNQLKQIINILEEDKIKAAEEANEHGVIKVPETEDEIM